MEAFGYLAIMGIGMVLGSVGAGGSMLAIPVLVYAFSIDMETASAYSLFLVGTTSLAGAALKQRHQRVSVRSAFLFGIPSVAGAFTSRKWIVVRIPDPVWNSDNVVLSKDNLLLSLFCLLVLSSAICMLLKRTPASAESRDRHVLRLMSAGLMVGAVAGLAGAGGGFLILPALVIFAALPFFTAVGTSLLVIASNSLLGFCGDVMNRSIPWQFLFSLTGLAILGLLVGLWLHERMGKSYHTQRVFAWLMLVIGLSVLAELAGDILSGMRN